MFRYSILIQFAKTDAPPLAQHVAVIHQAVEYYNQRSRMALNPKEIISCELKDAGTLEVILESTNQLQEATASKALRLFSQYLVSDTTPNNLSSYVSNRRLFKMSSSFLSSDSGTAARMPPASQDKEAPAFSSLNTDEKLERIYTMLEKILANQERSHD